MDLYLSRTPFPAYGSVESPGGQKILQTELSGFIGKAKG